jgi:hypothetical protein
VLPEFPTAIFMAVLIAVTLIAATLGKKALNKKQKKFIHEGFS